MKEQKKCAALLAAVLSWSLSAHAGWYVVDNYQGHIGPYAVHLSLQQRDGFGSGLNLLGSYYFDSRHAPIPLYGKRVGAILELCEVHNPSEYDKYLIQGSKHGFDTSHCPFKLISGDRALRGTWQDGGRRYDVSMTSTASLDDTTSPGSAEGEVDIPFWGQTETHAFVGVYQGTAEGLAIRRINVIDKKTGKVDQVVDPQLHGCQFGFFMTPIYMNLESAKSPYEVQLNCYSNGRFDVTVGYRFDKASHRYRVVGDN
ncbi:hypothetical protein [Burkholderia ubonensis]|uniref:hypothetical protein n=1 Tax=Burkholderia ubonensis TaxID=101571 RepID=UPI0005D92C65|nr:hypothetical protein [Burkholderia ubonensis]AJX13230.1 hypothetical protein BW23_4525 [Burkholderia ubonensis MSMB22]